MAETNAASIAEGLLRQVLMAFVSFWYEKNKDMSITSRHVDTPVITNEQVKSWLESLANVFETELDNAVTESSTTKAYSKFLEKYTDPKSVENVANRINDAMRKSKSYDNFINSMHGSIRAIVINDQSVKSNDKIVHIGSGHVKPGAKLWFVPSAVFENKKRSMKTNNDNAVINALQNELCIYEMYSPQDCSGGKTGKVIQCPKSSGGFKNIAEILAKTINEKLNGLYDCPNPMVAVPRLLSQIKYKNKFKDPNTGKEFFKDVTGIDSSYTDGVDIDCSEPLRTKSGEPIDPRLAVTRLFNERQIDYVASDAEKISETVNNAKTSEDTDEEASFKNKEEGDVASGHNTMVANYANSGIDEDLVGLDRRCKAASGWIKTLQTAAELYGLWPAGMYDKLEISSGADVYEKILKTAEWLSKYIISTGNNPKHSLPPKYKPFGVNVILGKDRFVLATNVMPSKESGDSLSLHAYAQFIKDGIVDGQEEASQKGSLRGRGEYDAMVSSKKALENMVSFIEKAYRTTKAEVYSDASQQNKNVGVENADAKLAQVKDVLGTVKVPLGRFIEAVGMNPGDFDFNWKDPYLKETKTFNEIMDELNDRLEKHESEHNGFTVRTTERYDQFNQLDHKIATNRPDAVEAAQSVIDQLKAMVVQPKPVEQPSEPKQTEPQTVEPTDTPKETQKVSEPSPEREQPSEESDSDEDDSRPPEPYADNLSDVDNISNDL